MSNSAIDKQTNPPTSPEGCGSNTALHLCALYDKSECMKLLLRSGADVNIKNSQNKTPMDIVEELGHNTCHELVIKSIIHLALFQIHTFSVTKCGKSSKKFLRQHKHRLEFIAR